MSPSKTLFYFCLSFIAGIGLNSIIKIPQIFIWGIFVLGLGIIITSFFIRSSSMVIFGFCILALLLGITRFQISQFTIANDQLSKLNDTPDKITLVGFVWAEPDIRQTSKKIKVKVDDSTVLVTLSNFNTDTYQYLDRVQLVGTLKTPAIFEDFNYKNYLMKDGIYSVMDYPKIELISEKHTYNVFTYSYEKILWLKSKLLNGLNINLFPPHSFILEGMVFGNDKNMSAELKDKFNVTGLSHVTAVSGTNIVIIISMMMIVLLAMGFWRGQAFYLSAIFIFTYIVLIGFPPSGIRAAVMGCIGLSAQKLGRQNTNWRILVLAGSLMLMQNPLLLAYDVGFQLSFLASLGIIYLKPLIDIFLKMVTREHLKFFTDLMSVTLAAQIITLPIIVYNFGRLSVIAPISNLLALPVVEALTVLGFLLSIVGAILPFASFLFSIPCWFLLTYFMWVLDIFSKPWAVLSIENFPWFFVVLYYAIIFVVIKFLQKYQKPKFLGC
ncbi:MAG: ComEC family competence protein [Candidatus Staskawiczbacteria bacterium]|nr:ComEC family competence protein [Candidatus Staskawiczbacteria bacterium]